MQQLRRSHDALAQLLVVEDDPAIAAVLSDALRDAGHSVRLAGTGTDALAELHRGLPDLILLDLMLPSGPDGAAAAQELGAPIFVAKPFDLHVLLGQIDRLCSGSVRQCAWCRRVMDDAGDFRLRSGRNLRWATHGICPECKERERSELLN